MWENGIVCSLIDAKHDNIYMGLFDFSKETYSTILLKACNIEEVAEILRSEEIKKVVGDKQITFVGDGAVIYYDRLSKLQNIILTKENEFLSSSFVKIGITKLKNKDNSELLPLYLKKSQAERLLDGEKS